MKRVYNYLIWKLGLILVALTYPYILSYISEMSKPQIDCVEWYKVNTGFCDDFSEMLVLDSFILSIVLLILPIVFSTVMWSYIIKPKPKEVNQNGKT